MHSFKALLRTSFLFYLTITGYACLIIWRARFSPNEQILRGSLLLPPYADQIDHAVPPFIVVAATNPPTRMFIDRANYSFDELVIDPELLLSESPSTGYALSTTPPLISFKSNLPARCCYFSNADCYFPYHYYNRDTRKREQELYTENKLKLVFRNDAWNIQRENPVRGDLKLNCGLGRIDVFTDVHPWFYFDSPSCVQVLRQIRNKYRYCPVSSKDMPKRHPAIPLGAKEEYDVVLYHAYWQGTNIHYQVSLAILSFVATQDIKRSRFVIWSDAASFAALRADSKMNILPLNRSLLDLECIEIRLYDVKEQVCNTKFREFISAFEPVLQSKDIHDSLHWVDSDLFRLLILHNFGGVYVDFDTLLLRDFAPILGQEFFYIWQQGCDHLNGALARLFRESPTSKELLLTLARTPINHGSTDWGAGVYNAVYAKLGNSAFTRFPSCFFDQLWNGGWSVFLAEEIDWPSWDGPFANHIHGGVWSTPFEPGSGYDLIGKEFLGKIGNLELVFRGG